MAGATWINEASSIALTKCLGYPPTLKLFLQSSYWMSSCTTDRPYRVLLPFRHRQGVLHLSGPGGATKGVDEQVDEVLLRGTNSEPTEASTPGCIICCGRYCGTTGMCPQCEGAVAGLDSVGSECSASSEGVCSLCMGPGTPGTSICGACESAAMEATEQTDGTQLARRINFEGAVESDVTSKIGSIPPPPPTPSRTAVVFTLRPMP
ncbi:hypothetical protein FOZ60_009679 [Perkinsus olseni]|uniref:Uncharacterized protein n=1 Tax=Perkinsus olseni TaxID=32597 RepID=A0A7J6PCM1_PEROL|nr:hypothetical protein FOZ60_009679 [Perkinsus olseni]